MLTEQEFEKRWRAAAEDRSFDCISQEFSEDDLPLSIDTLWDAAKALKRPWICDCRGLPPAALLSSAFMVSALPALKQLLVRDAPWTNLEEQGYVKMKERGSTHVRKLRGIIPNSTVLRLLTS